MNKVILSGIIIVIIIGIVSVLYTSTFLVESKGIESTPKSSEEATKSESQPQGRNLSIEFDEKIGLSAP
jgi:hypothetical protein